MSELPVYICVERKIQAPVSVVWNLEVTHYSGAAITLHKNLIIIIMEISVGI